MFLNLLDTRRNPGFRLSSTPLSLSLVFDFFLKVWGGRYFCFFCFYAYIMLCYVCPAAAARNRKNFILKKRVRVMSAQKRNHRIILSKLTNSKTNIQILQIIGQNIKILLMRQFLKHLIFIRHLFIKYQCLCLLYNIHTHTIYHKEFVCVFIPIKFFDQYILPAIYLSISTKQSQKLFFDIVIFCFSLYTIHFTHFRKLNIIGPILKIYFFFFVFLLLLNLYRIRGRGLARCKLILYEYIASDGRSVRSGSLMCIVLY